MNGCINKYYDMKRMLMYNYIANDRVSMCARFSPLDLFSGKSLHISACNLWSTSISVMTIIISIIS